MDINAAPENEAVSTGKPYKKNEAYVATTFIPNESQQF